MLELETFIAFVVGLGLVPIAKLTTKLAVYFWNKMSKRATFEIDELFDVPVKPRKTITKKVTKKR